MNVPKALWKFPNCEIAEIAEIFRIAGSFATSEFPSERNDTYAPVTAEYVQMSIYIHSMTTTTPFNEHR